MNNIIFVFSGTGNSLSAAQCIANTLGSCKIVSMGKKDYELNGVYNAIGFVYPVYYQGMPAQVAAFIKGLDFSGNEDAYCFGVATYGLLAGNGLTQLASLLAEKEKGLDYGEKLQMFSNCVTMYDMRGNVEQITKKSDKMISELANKIKSGVKNRIGGKRWILDWYYSVQINRVNLISKGYHTDNNCVGCGICEKVCPVNNIKIENGTPIYFQHCEHCVACIQYCPNKAINYKNKTQKRGRYHHPDVNYQTLAEFNM